MKNFLIFGSNRLNENNPIGEFIKILKQKKINYHLITEQRKLNIKSANNLSFKEFLKKKNIKYSVEKKISINKIRKYINKNTVAISFNSTWKFKNDLIKLLKKNFYNYHCADLPSQKGAGCISWNILRDIYQTSLNFHLVTEEYDSGDIALRKIINLPKKNINYPSDYLNYLSKYENFFFLNFVNKIMKDKIKLQKQYGNSFYWPRLNAEKDGRIDWSYNGDDIVKFIKAFSHPYSGAYTFIKNLKCKIYEAKFYKSKKFHPYQNGIVFRVEKNFIYVANTKGVIKIDKKSIICKKKTKFLGKKLL